MSSKVTLLDSILVKLGNGKVQKGGANSKNYLFKRGENHRLCGL
jgi:hypothetical protein